MEKQTGKQLLAKLKDGNISPEELKLLESWYEDYISKEVPFDDAPLFLKDMETLDKAFPFEIEKQIGKRTTYKLWSRIVAGVAAVALIVLGVYFYSNRETLKQVHGDVVVNDVAPGKVGATLTLASGKKIRLTDAATGELANESGIHITKTADGQLVYEIKGSDIDPNKINTLSTAKGETYHMRLPDGSMVYLNAASSLTYAASLIERGKRIVRLYGEGYFEISKDKMHPFVVQTDNQEVEVLGTHFNVNAYENEKTTLLEGSVKVNYFAIASGKNGKVSYGKKVLLKPNQQAVLTTDNQVKVQQADLEEEMSWKNGDFVFNGVRIGPIMQILARWYNIEVSYEGPVSSELYYAKISRSKNISEVLRSLEKAKGVHFKIEGRRIIVIP